MHRTVGNAYIEKEIGGVTIRLFQDETGEEGVLGTEYYSGMANSVQEEISRVIEHVGLTLYDDDIEDESNEWGQLKTAIFESEAIDTDAITDGAITNDKVTSVSLTKLITGNCSISKVIGVNTNILQINESYIKINKSKTSGTYPIYEFSLYPEYLQLKNWPSVLFGQYTEWYYKYDGITASDKRTFGSEKKVTFDSDGLTVELLQDEGKNFSASTTSGFTHILFDGVSIDRSMAVNAFGIYFNNSNLHVKFTCVPIPTTGWAGSGPYAIDVATDIPKDAKILSASFSIQKSSNDYVYIFESTHVVNEIWFRPSGDIFNANIELNYDPQGTTYKNLYLMVWYDDIA